MLYVMLANALFLVRGALSGQETLRKQLYYCVLLALFIFSAFRFQVGCDWSSYYSQYLRSEHLDWSSIVQNREPIWWAVLKGMQTFGLNWLLVNVFSSALFFVGVHVLARRQPDPLGFLVLLFPIMIINLPMSGIRQGAAMGMLCIAFSGFIDRRPVWFSFWVVVGAGFHASAALFLLLLPLVTGQYTKARLLISGILALPGAYLFSTSEVTQLAVDRYFDTGVEAFGAVFRVGFLSLSALYFLLFLKEKWKLAFPKDFPIVHLGAFAMLLLFPVVQASSVIGDRFAYYLFPIQAIIFARLPYLNFRYLKALHSVLPYLGSLIFFIAWSQLSRHFQHCYIPYNSWIFGIPHEAF